MFMTLISCHFVTLISETQIFSLPTSDDNFQEENVKKICQSDFCWKYISLYVLFLDDILYRRAQFVRELCSL